MKKRIISAILAVVLSLGIGAFVMYRYMIYNMEVEIENAHTVNITAFGQTDSYHCE